MKILENLDNHKIVQSTLLNIMLDDYTQRF